MSDSSFVPFVLYVPFVAQLICGFLHLSGVRPQAQLKTD